MEPQKKFELIDRFTELESAIKCLSLDTESINNEIIKSKISVLLDSIRGNIYQIEEKPSSNSSSNQPGKNNISLNNNNTTNSTVNSNSVKKVNTSTNNTSSNKQQKPDHTQPSNNNWKKVFADGATNFATRIISFGNKFAVTSHEKGEINLWDIEFYTHLDKETTCHNSTIFSLVVLHEGAKKFASCCFSKQSKLTLWSISKRNELSMENTFEIDNKVRNMTYLKTQTLAYLLLARMDNKIDVFDVKCDYIYSYVEIKLTLELTFVFTSISFIYCKHASSESDSKKLLEDKDKDKDKDTKEKQHTEITEKKDKTGMSEEEFNKMFGGFGEENVESNTSNIEKNNNKDKENKQDNSNSKVDNSDNTPENEEFEVFILGGGKNGQLVHLSFSSKESLFEKYVIETNKNIFNYCSGENDQIEVIHPLNHQSKVFLTGSLKFVMKLYKANEATPVKTIHIFPNIVSSMKFIPEENILVVGSSEINVFKVSSSSNNNNTDEIVEKIDELKSPSDLKFELIEKIDSGYVVDDFVIQYQENNLSRSSFIWINMDSRLLRIITPKYVVK